MARTRTTKKLAQRIDLNYFKRPTPLKRVKLWLSVLLPALALVWIAWRGFSGDHRVYSSGRMSKAHAVLEKECAACHVKQAGAFSAKAADSACLACHDGPAHHANQIQAKVPHCATCHTEHRGRINSTAVSDQTCAECHAELKVSDSIPQYERHIHSFENGHPEFAALRSRAGVPAADTGTIQVNHAIHMKPLRRGPNGPAVQLECGDCHRLGAASGEWTYADAHYTAANASNSVQSEALPLGTQGLQGSKPLTGRELMAPVRFAFACAGCHSLAFDKRFEEGVPHDSPEIVHSFLVKKFQEYVVSHPSEVRVVRDPNRDLTGKPLPPEVLVLTPAQWVKERVADAEELLWRKTCKQCHALNFREAKQPVRIPQTATQMGDALARGAEKSGLPEIASAHITRQWMRHSKFGHDAHRGFACASCHEKALTSMESSDILLPGIKTCQKCHAPGPDHAESRCFECHTYHDWSKRKEMAPKFILPALRTGGQ